MPTSSASSGSTNSGREYQPLLPRPLETSKTRMNDSRYSTSGTIHRNGTEATFCVMWLVHASSISEPSADSANHSA